MFYWIILGVVWFLGAALCLKLGAIKDKVHTDYRLMCIAIPFWPIAAVVELATDHEVKETKVGF